MENDHYEWSGLEKYVLLKVSYTIDGKQNIGYSCLSDKFQGNSLDFDPNPLWYYKDGQNLACKNRDCDGDSQNEYNFQGYTKFPSWMCQDIVLRVSNQELYKEKNKCWYKEKYDGKVINQIIMQDEVYYSKGQLRLVMILLFFPFCCFPSFFGYLVFIYRARIDGKFIKFPRAQCHIYYQQNRENLMLLYNTRDIQLKQSMVRKAIYMKYGLEADKIFIFFKNNLQNKRKNPYSVYIHMEDRVVQEDEELIIYHINHKLRSLFSLQYGDRFGDKCLNKQVLQDMLIQFLIPLYRVEETQKNEAFTIREQQT